jgi:hypothetical protein
MAQRNQPVTSTAAEISAQPSSTQATRMTRFHLASWHGEVRILRLTAFAIPALAAIGLIGLATLLRARGVNPDFVNAFLGATLEAFLPLAAGILLMGIAAKDDALEVQLSLVTPYRNTVARRVALLLGWMVSIEFAATLAILAIFPAALTKSGFDLVLLWLAPALWLSALGVLLALLLRSRATAIALLGVVWVVQLAFHGYFATFDWTRPWFLFATLYTPDAPYWRLNRLELIATAIACLVMSWLYLRNNEWRFRGEDVSA